MKIESEIVLSIDRTGEEYFWSFTDESDSSVTEVLYQGVIESSPDGIVRVAEIVTDKVLTDNYNACRLLRKHVAETREAVIDVIVKQIHRVIDSPDEIFDTRYIYITLDVKRNEPNSVTSRAEDY